MDEPATEFDIKLPFRCGSCRGKVLVTYRPVAFAAMDNAYICPHCRNIGQVNLPGILLPPVKVDQRPPHTLAVQTDDP